METRVARKRVWLSMQVLSAPKRSAAAQIAAAVPRLAMPRTSASWGVSTRRFASASEVNEARLCMRHTVPPGAG
jgi:hypothetical protein